MNTRYAQLRARLVALPAIVGLALVTWLSPPVALAADGVEQSAFGRLHPDRLALRHGVASDARSTVVGLQWDLPRRWNWAGHGAVSTHAEFALGHWRADTDGERAFAVVTQIGLTPVVRYSFRHDGGWFIEGGIGANVIAPLYRSRDKRFSSAFNFGDHVGVGWRSYRPVGWEWSLRLQHFSNAGLSRPNPGEDFVQFQVAVDLR